LISPLEGESFLNNKIAAVPIAGLVLVSFMAVGFVVSVGALTEGTLALDPELIMWETGCEPAGLTFDVDVNITDVTDLMGIVFSVEWDPTYLNCTSYTPGDFVPVGYQTLGWFIGWDYENGKMKEAAIVFAIGYGPVSVSSPAWGWVMTLHFKYLGPTPPLGVPVDTYINITKRPAEYMDTTWVDSSNVYWDFNFLVGDPIVDQCHFHYESVVPEWKPVADFSIISPFPLYKDTSVSFDASSSAGSYDGDSITSITEYWWDFGDGGGWTMAVSPTTSHTYTTSGEYVVCLYVVAPGVPPYIDPDYNDTSDTTYELIFIHELDDIAIESVTYEPLYVFNSTSPPLNITVLVSNIGTVEETFDLNVYYNITATEWTLIETKSVTLGAPEEKNVTLTWNTTGLDLYVSYTLKVNVSILEVIDGTIEIRLPGDVTGDRGTNYEDLFLLADAYGSTSDDDNWDPRCDFNGDGKVDYEDLFTLADYYGTWI
jgi:hypothetical protein